ncbi:MAG: DUF1015 domain-containing protein [Collinsella sp.]|uniref:DUF1015 domain-containing protein n=1 Tax=Collinsella sp. TaxID=1965294 RepID=UPI002E787DDD|nr:DUF1015 domain-containing protein [Collinsella sp.]MEE0703447.1 DUF1015 domain-containing protein [Collinsella sp.]
MKALPFPCIRPVPEHAAEVAALPYDVFDRAEAAAYVAGHPLSFLNIDRPETQFDPEHDMYAPEVYARGAELLRERIEDGTFVEDKNLAYYIYQLAWEGRVQTGIACVCAVDDYEQGVIKRHELTREDKERDRIEHIEALGCQTGPIFLTYRDQPVLDMIVGAAKTSTPLYDFTDEAGVRQTVWEVARRDAVDALHAMLGQIPCAYIADGHHRAASAVKVAQRMREQAKAEGMYTGKEPFNYFLSVLFPASQLTILPYNRVVADRNGLDTHELLEALSGTGFGIIEATGPVEPSERGVFGMFTDGTWYELHGDMRDAVSAVASLDVSILQDHILAPILGIDDPRTDPRISFVGGIRGTDELEVRAGKNGIAFTLCATGIDQLLTIADAGEVMPPKSTWFEPKLRSGLFIHRIAK